MIAHTNNSNQKITSPEPPGGGLLDANNRSEAPAVIELGYTPVGQGLDGVSMFKSIADRVSELTSLKQGDAYYCEVKHGTGAIADSRAKDVAALLLDSDKRGAVFKLIKDSNSVDALVDVLQRLNVTIDLAPEEKKIILDGVKRYPGSLRLKELAVPLLFGSQGPEVEALMREVFKNSLQREPHACAFAAAWILRECKGDKTVARETTLRALAGDYYMHSDYRNPTIMELDPVIPLFASALCNTGEPIAVAIAALAADQRLGQWYRSLGNPLASIKAYLFIEEPTFMRAAGIRLGLEPVITSNESAYKTLRDLLREPVPSSIEREMIEVLHRSGDPVNERFLHDQLNAKWGWLAPAACNPLANDRVATIRDVLNKKSSKG
jgi:hypothetical protein